jgi:hypothetical protein
MLKTWNRVTNESIAINANVTWGMRDWTCGTGVFQISEMTSARGKVGMANSVTIVGRKRFLERWKSTIMAYQVVQFSLSRGTSGD